LAAGLCRRPTPRAVSNSIADGFDVPEDLFYIPGEMGIRHEDTVAVTEGGCENLAPKWSGTPEEPVLL
jgi:Xaa-Pro aminopeptidase